MLYIFFEMNAVTPELYEKWLSEVSPQRRESTLKYRFHKDRLLSVCAYRLLCFALKRNAIAFDFVGHGKPMLPDDIRHFSLSHCDGCVAVGISDNEIGVDAESVKPYPPNIIRRVFTENETAQIKNSPQPDITFFKLWTLKESYVKAIGKGLSFPLKDIDFILSGEEIICSDAQFACASHVLNAHVISVCEKRSVMNYENNYPFPALQTHTLFPTTLRIVSPNELLDLGF